MRMKLSWHDYKLSMSLKLNACETIEWKSPLRVGISSKFRFILYDMVVLEAMSWNSPLRLALVLAIVVWFLGDESLT
jgi:hypothetical protein